MTLDQKALEAAVDALRDLEIKFNPPDGMSIRQATIAEAQRLVRASRSSAIVEEPIVADESIDHHAYRVAHIPEPSRSPQPHTGRADHVADARKMVEALLDLARRIDIDGTPAQIGGADEIRAIAALTVEPEAPDNAFAEYEGVPAKELAETVARYGKALKEISSPTQTEGLLWWQIKAREALAGVEPEAGEVTRK